MSIRMRRLIRWLGFALAGLAVLTVISGLAGWRWMRAALPPVGAKIHLAGIEGWISVHRDGVGIPTIGAGNEHDAWFGLGWVHAEDRLWQMEFLRRVGSGRLSEIMGARTLELDKYMRTLGLFRVAEANLVQMSPDMRAVLQAYAEGVNAWIDHHRGPLPPEFLLLRVRPEPWRPVDTVLWGRLMALQLSDNYQGELNRLRIAEALTPEQLASLFSADAADGPISIGSAGAAAALRLADALPRLEEVPGLAHGASNAWVISGSHTQSGKPILANDPHLGFAAPNLWYLARIRMPGLTLTGATVPGVPAVLIGHNGKIAWGFTNTHSDTQDLFVERLVGTDHYASPQGPLPFITRTERILVRGAAPVDLVVRETRHGPVLSDVEEQMSGIGGEGHVVALAWPALRPDDRTAEAVLRLNRARNWTEFESALRDFHSPQQNIFYADRAGHIGMMAPARVPIRAKGNGLLPVTGWSGEHDWTGFIPFEQLPRSLDPPSGRIVNANNRIVPDEYPYLIAAEWEAPYRARLIEEALNHDDLETPQRSLSLQHNTLSLAARDLLPAMLRFEPGNLRQRRARTLLEGWDFHIREDRPEGLIFNAWLLALNEALFADELGPAFGAFGRWNAERIGRALMKDTAWCEDHRTDATDSCAAVLAGSLDQALEELSRRHGEDMDRWRWGAVHRAHFAHTVFSGVPILSSLFDRKVPIGGDNYTLARATPRTRGQYRFEAIHGAGVRAVFDLADLDRSEFVMAMGQSGNPVSPEYDNLLEDWRRGSGRTMVEPSEAAPVRRYFLVPAQGGR